MKHTSRVLAAFAVILALVFTSITWYKVFPQETTALPQQYQEKAEQSLQELNFPEWDGVYLWTTDNKFEELKPLKKFTIFPVRCPLSGKPYPGWYTLDTGLFQSFNSEEFNVFPVEKVQGFFIRGKDYLECVKLYKVYRHRALLGEEYFRYDENDYYTPSKRRTVSSEGVLIRIDDFGTEFGLAEKNRYLLIVYKCPGSKGFKDAKFWVVGVTGSSR